MIYLSENKKGTPEAAGNFWCGFYSVFLIKGRVIFLLVALWLFWITNGHDMLIRYKIFAPLQ
jgi:hypothetical protein